MNTAQLKCSSTRVQKLPLTCFCLSEEMNTKMILDVITSANKKFQLPRCLRSDSGAFRSHYSNVFNGYLSDWTGSF